MQQLLDACITLAQQAGEAILDIYQSENVGQKTKQDDTPVTKADLAANKVIVAGLENLTPDTPIMSEESPIPPLAKRSQWQRYWLIDPMDGTGEFILQSGDFAVNIALIEDNQPVLGVIHWPTEGITYYASKGQGAFKLTEGKTTQISVESPNELTLAISRRQKIEKVSRFINQPFNTIAVGSCSLKACMVAEGKADAFLRVGPTGEWDTGASQIIVEEAGGTITDGEFNPLSYNQRETTENPDFIVMGHPDWQWQKLIKPHTRD